MTKASVLFGLVLLLAACAETDPYKRLPPVPTPAMETTAIAASFNTRWPEQFKCVQTVTLDFRVATRTLMGYLIVQQPGRFRLQGMSEQGLKLFDIAYTDGQVVKIFAAEEFDQKILDNIARDISRVFLFGVDASEEAATSLGRAGLVIKSNEVRPQSDGTRAIIAGRYADLDLKLVGDPPHVDFYDYRQADRSLYRVDQYEWKDFDGFFASSKIVLRERGVQSQGPPYKLTIDISELVTRDNPWPERVFEAPKEDE